MLGQIYLLVSPEATIDDDGPAELLRVAGMLGPLLADGSVMAVLLRGGLLTEDLQRAWIGHLCPLVQQQDCAFLVEDRVDLAAELGCDGVHLSNGRAVAASRQALGGDMIVGALCANSRHQAMLAGEQGADYVAFAVSARQTEPVEESEDPLMLLEWWQEVMTLPCVAFGAASFDDCRKLAKAGADFLAVDRIVWDHPESPRAALRQLGSLLAN